MNKPIANNFRIRPETEVRQYIFGDNHDIMKLRGGSDRTGPHTPPNVIPFQPDWVGPNGGITELGPWVEHYLAPDQMVIGVRWVDGEPRKFVIRRDADWGWLGQFDLLDPDVCLHVRPGKMEVVEKATRKVLRRVVKTVDENQDFDWQLEFAIEPRSYRNTVDECPAILWYAWTHINHYVQSITGVGRDISTSLRGMCKDYGDPKENKPTPPEVVLCWRYTRELWQRAQSRSIPVTKPNMLYETIQHQLWVILTTKVWDPSQPPQWLVGGED